MCSILFVPGDFIRFFAFSIHRGSQRKSYSEDDKPRRLLNTESISVEKRNASCRDDHSQKERSTSFTDFIYTIVL